MTHESTSSTHPVNTIRARLLAWLAIERADLLRQLASLDDQALHSTPIMEHWTGCDMLAHVAAWDAYFAYVIRMARDGRAHEVADVDLDKANATFYNEMHPWSLQQALQACTDARQVFLSTFAEVPDDVLNAKHPFGWGEATLGRCAEWRAFHDRNHAAQIAAWARTHQTHAPRNRISGSRALLLASLEASRKALWEVMSLLDPSGWDSLQVCGTWTLTDVAGHLADWDLLCVDAIEQLITGISPKLEYDGNYDAWNTEHVAVRRRQPAETAWGAFAANRKTLVDLLSGLKEHTLNSVVGGRWGGTAYWWAYICLEHDLEHIAILQTHPGIGRVTPE